LISTVTSFVAMTNDLNKVKSGELEKSHD